MARNRAMSAGSVIGLVAMLALVHPAQATMIVTQENDPGILATTLLGGGITINSSAVFGAPQAFGTFTNGATVGGGFFDSGVVLSTGRVIDAAGPNVSDSTTTNFGVPGNAALTNLAGFQTFDAAVFEMNFTTVTGDIFFNYIFASEEYNEFTNTQFNDTFAFFLDGQNIALIPGTTIPVSINTVNGGDPLGVNASNPNFYNNNDLNDGGPFFDIEYDGFTDVFTAKALGLSAGEHTLTLAIADASDQVLDSAVFLQAGSFFPVQVDEKPPFPALAADVAHGFPLKSANPVFLNTEAGGEAFDGTIDIFHTKEKGYYSLDFDVNSGNATVVATKAGEVSHVFAREVLFEKEQIIQGVPTKIAYVPVVIVGHGNGYFTEYAEFDTVLVESDALRRVFVSEGDKVIEGTALGALVAEPNSHLHYQVKFDPLGAGVSAGSSTEPNPAMPENEALRDVTVGGRLFKDYMLPFPPSQAQIYGQVNPLLPNTNDINSEAFNFNVVVGDLGVGKDLPIFVDPEIAVGYDYQIISGPLFASVLLPDIGDGLFELWLFDSNINDFMLTETLLAGIIHDFGVNGVDQFRILGIEESLGLDPNDASAFVTGLTFTDLGPVSFAQTPIRQQVPEPSALPLFAFGLGSLFFFMRRGRKILAEV